MGSVNEVTLIGRLGRDPEIRYTHAGVAVATVSLATSSYAGKDQEQKTEWHRCVLFEKLAELAGEHLHKGAQVYFSGSLANRSYEGTDKVTRHVTEVKVRRMQFLEAKRDGQAARPPAARPPAARPQQAQQDEHSQDSYGYGPVGQGLGGDNVPF